MAQGDLHGRLTGTSPTYVELADGTLIQAVAQVSPDGAAAGTEANPLVVQTDTPARILTTIASVTMTTADTQYSVVIPAGSRDVALRLADPNVPWRISPDSGVVAGGGGFRLSAGEALILTGTREAQTVYVASSASGQTMTVLRD